MRILPAGVPYGLSRLGCRFRAFFADTPLLFIGLVIGIAVVFRLGLGAVKTASADPETASIPIPHVPIPTSTAQPDGKPVETATEPAAEPVGTTTTPRQALPRRKPRTHGKR